MNLSRRNNVAMGHVIAVLVQNAIDDIRVPISEDAVVPPQLRDVNVAGGKRERRLKDCQTRELNSLLDMI